MLPERIDPPPLFDPLGEGADELSTSMAADDPYATSKPKKGKVSIHIVLYLYMQLHTYTCMYMYIYMYMQLCTWCILTFYTSK